jgi:hypothetical protein
MRPAALLPRRAEEMKMDFAKEFTHSLPSAEELIRALGLHARRGNHGDIVPSLALFGAGLLVGAGLALLFAPTSGRELRDELGERAAELRDRASGAVEHARSDVNAARPL